MAKRNSNEETIDEVINKLIRSYGLKGDQDEYLAVQAYKQVMGGTIVKYTEDIYIKNKRMHIKLGSSVIREELSMAKSKIIKMINDQVGKVVILDVTFV